jgi:uncharacterized membrane protein
MSQVTDSTAPGPPGSPAQTPPAGVAGPPAARVPARPTGAAPAAGPGRPEALADRLARIEALLSAGHGGRPPGGHRPVPAWRRVTRGEPRWASTTAVVAVVAIQYALPARLAISPRALMPAVELALLVALVAADPHRIERRSRAYRATGLALALVIGGANAYSAVRLVVGLVRGTEDAPAGALLLTGGAIWLTNIVIFALLYWELDRGGPAARAQAERDMPDFLFVQMQSPELAPPHWEPAFFDYFHLSFTNSTAFSPTDVLPMTRWAKALMLAQSAVSLMTVVLVVARAVNILR